MKSINPSHDSDHLAFVGLLDAWQNQSPVIKHMFECNQDTFVHTTSSRLSWQSRFDFEFNPVVPTALRESKASQNFNDVGAEVVRILVALEYMYVHKRMCSYSFMYITVLRMMKEHERIIWNRQNMKHFVNLIPLFARALTSSRLIESAAAAQQEHWNLHSHDRDLIKVWLTKWLVLTWKYCIVLQACVAVGTGNQFLVKLRGMMKGRIVDESRLQDE